MAVISSPTFSTQTNGSTTQTGNLSPSSAFSLNGGLLGGTPSIKLPPLPGTPAAQTSATTSSNSLPSVFQTGTGGTTFPASAAATYNKPTPQPTAASTPTASLASFLSNTATSPNGGQFATDGNGNVTGYTPPTGYSIDTSGASPSSALGNTSSLSDVMGQQSQYQDYVNALSQAQGYSPEYQQALAQQYGTQSQGAYLQSVGAGINANLATGAGLAGHTTDQAQVLTGQQQALNTQQEAVNTQQQTQANIALNTQQLARTGNIASAQSQLQYNPVAVSGENAINQYNSLQQQYPAASIPAYNPALSPATNQQIAQELVSNSPAYKSQFQQTYQTAGGGTGIYNKLDLSGLQQNQDGSYTLVPAAAAALGSANANILNTQLGNLSNINGAIDASTKTLNTTQQFMQQYGLNNTGVSILSQIQNSTNKNLDKAGAVAGLNADLNTLRSDYAQYLIGRGGSVAGTNQEAQDAIPDTISSSQLQTLVQQMQQDGQNTASAVNTQVQNALQGLSSGSYSGQTSGGSTSTSSGWGSLGD